MLNLLNVTNKIFINVVFVSVFLLMTHKELLEFVKSVLILSYNNATAWFIVPLITILFIKN